MGQFQEIKVIDICFNRYTSAQTDGLEHQGTCCKVGLPTERKMLENTAFILHKNSLLIFRTLNMND